MNFWDLIENWSWSSKGHLSVPVLLLFCWTRNTIQEISTNWIIIKHHHTWQVCTMSSRRAMSRIVDYVIIWTKRTFYKEWKINNRCFDFLSKQNILVPLILDINDRKDWMDSGCRKCPIAMCWHALLHKEERKLDFITYI